VDDPLGQAATKEILKDLSADFIYTLTEGKGVTGRTALPPIM